MTVLPGVARGADVPTARADPLVAVRVLRRLPPIRPGALARLIASRTALGVEIAAVLLELRGDRSVRLRPPRGHRPAPEPLAEDRRMRGEDGTSGSAR